VDEAREERLEQLFAAAAALPPEDRPAFLEAKCGADPSLRAELASLLADAGEADGFLDRVAGPVVVRAAEAFTDQSEGTVLTMSPDLDRLNTALSDRYAVEREIGRGGMATVYLAEDLKHSRQVAIKVLRPDLAATLGAERFLNEIRTIANLHHPHILSLHDSGEADSFLYYVMPYVAGESLREKLDREKQLPVEEAVRIASEVAEALEYAHGREVTHRDIKPANILLHEGRALVTDFGIAIALGASGGERLTETGLSVGTPQYMSPEQARGDWEPDGRSDLYSLGCVLYEMLTGEPPHTGVSAQAIIRKIVTEDVQPATELRESVPPHVAAAVAQSLEKLPADRFESAKAFAEALGDVTFTSRGTAAGLGQVDSVAGRGPPWRLVSAVVGLAIVAGSAGWILRPIPEIPRRPVQFFIESDSAHRILPGSAALSPDGSVLVYSARTDSGSVLYRRRIDELEAHPIAGTAGGLAPFFSPDGAQLGFSTEGALRRVRLDGGAPRIITEFDGDLLGADWGDDDEIVFSTWRPKHVYTVSADGGTPEFLEVLDRLTDTLWIGSPAFIPGARALLFAAMGRVGVVSLDSADVRWLMPGFAARYVRSGHLVYLQRDGSLLAQPFDVAKLDTAGPARRVLEGLGLILLPSGSVRLAMSSSGTLAYNLANEGHGLVLVDRDGTEQLLLRGRAFWLPRFSPDGTRIAFGEIAAQQDIWIRDLAAATTSRLTFDGQENNDPVWNPDGTSVAFSHHKGAKDLYILSAEGGDPDLVVAQDGVQWTTDWSPDGRYLVFTKVINQDQDIWVAPLSGDGEPRPFLATRYDEGAARLSPNGRWLAYHSRESGQLEVYVQSFPEPGNKRLISTGGGKQPIWGPNGQELFYWNPRGQLIAQQLTVGDDITVGRRDVLFQLPDNLFEYSAQYDIHPDGQRFVIARNAMQNRLIVALDLIDQQP
jgi:Tol biopolymer transport system component